MMGDTSKYYTDMITSVLMQVLRILIHNRYDTGVRVNPVISYTKNTVQGYNIHVVD